MAGVLLPLLLGCQGPPQAPAELSELCSYFFTHMGEEDDEALAMGIENLAAWFAENGTEAPEDGFEVTQIDVETAYALPDIDLSATSREEFREGLVGAAVVNIHAHELDDLAWAIVGADQMEVFPSDYQVFERTFIDGDCTADGFLDLACDRVEAYNYSEASYAGLLQVKSENRAQWRWVRSEKRRALVHRAWLTGPAEISPALAAIPAEFFVTATFELDDGRMIRMQTVWFVATLASVEANDFLLSNFVGALSKSGEQVEYWLTLNAPDREPGAVSGGWGGCAAAPLGGGLLLALAGLWRRRS